MSDASLTVIKGVQDRLECLQQELVRVQRASVFSQAAMAKKLAPAIMSDINRSINDLKMAVHWGQFGESQPQPSTESQQVILTGREGFKWQVML